MPLIRAGTYLVAVDDATAVEVVRRKLDLDLVAGVDPDAEAAHLARGVPEGLVAVFELDLEQSVGEGLDDLAVQLDLLFFCRHMSLLTVARNPPQTAERRHNSGTASVAFAPGSRSEPSQPGAELLVHRRRLDQVGHALLALGERIALPALV